MNSAKGPSYSLHPEFCLFAFLSLFLLTVPWFYGLTTLRHQLLAELAVFGLALLAILFSIPNTVPGFWKNLLSRETRGGLDFWVFAGLIFCFAYVLISVYPYQSVLTWLRLFACVLFYFLIRGIVKNEKSFQYFLWVFVFAGA
ncbi:MAG TPA: hypothetical protein VD913_05250, partial [bacterium]|nr:hypothetical protein [bacterium]